MELSLEAVLRIARRWWWLLLLCPLVMGGLGYGATTRQTPKYAAQVTLRVEPVQPSGTIDYTSLTFAGQLAQSYQALITVRPVLEGVIQDLNLPYTVEQLRPNVTSMLNGSDMLVVRVSDTDAQRAADIANAVGDHFASYVVSTASTITIGNSNDMRSQLATLEQQITDTQNRIGDLTNSPTASDPAVQDQIRFLQNSLANLQPVRDGLKVALTAADFGLSTVNAKVSTVEPAIAPTVAYSPRPMLNIALGVFSGLLLAGAAVVGLVFLDKTVQSTTDFSLLGGVHLLTSIGMVPGLGSGRHGLFVLRQPNGEAAEAVRLLRTNIEFASAESEMATIAISSPNLEEGKSTVAANLAVSLAQAGFVIALVDADLRRPSLHKTFDVSNERGLSTLLTVPGLNWKRAVVDSGVPNLALIPSGPQPRNSADLLSGDRLGEVLEDMEKTFDVIVVDTPPILRVSDALVVAAQVDGVVLVAQAGRTSLDGLRRAASALRRGAVRIVGVAINQEQDRRPDGPYTLDEYAIDVPAIDIETGADESIEALPDGIPTQRDPRRRRPRALAN